MTIIELCRNRDWVEAIQRKSATDDFGLLRAGDPETETIVQQALRLVHLVLDRILAVQSGDLSKIDANYRVAKTLGKEFTGLAPNRKINDS